MNEQYDLLKNKLLELRNQFVPSLRRMGRTIPPWMTLTWILHKVIKVRNRPWYRFYDSPGDILTDNKGMSEVFNAFFWIRVHD